MKEKSTRHRDAIHKVADAVDNGLVTLVMKMDELDELGANVDLDGVLVQLAEARAYIVQAIGQAHAADVIESIKIDIENDQPRIYADEAMHDLQRAAKPTKLPKQRDSVFGDQHAAKLPKLKPQGHAKVKYKPGVTKLMRGADMFNCPTCHAEPGSNCFKFSGPGKNAELTDERNDGSFYHAKRQDLAKAYNDRIRKANILP
jgi:hypothetical protein